MLDVSIIIPCHNREPYIKEAIESALYQRGAEIEVVVIDDASTDGSWDVIKSFGNMIRALRLPTNRGVSAARNVGIKSARGTFVRFLDSDDRLPLGCISPHFARSRYLSPSQILVGDAGSINEEGLLIDPYGYGYANAVDDGQIINRQTMISFVMPAVLPLFPLAMLLEVGGFNESLSIGEDHEMALRLDAKGCSFVRIAEVVYQVREHRNPRLSRAKSAKGYTERKVYLEACWRLLKDITSAESAALGKLIWTAGRNASRDHFQVEANELFALATSIAGSAARNARFPLSAFYSFMSPYRAEQIMQLLKRRR